MHVSKYISIQLKNNVYENSVQYYIHNSYSINHKSMGEYEYTRLINLPSFD